MEFLVALAPIALILFACVGLHFFMMRGMQGGHGAANDHTGHGSAGDVDRVAQLEGQVARLQRELETSQGSRQGADNGHRREPVAATHHHDTAAGDDPGRGYN